MQNNKRSLLFCRVKAVVAQIAALSNHSPPQRGLFWPVFQLLGSKLGPKSHLSSKTAAQIAVELNCCCTNCCRNNKSLPKLLPCPLFCCPNCCRLKLLATTILPPRLFGRRMFSGQLLRVTTCSKLERSERLLHIVARNNWGLNIVGLNIERDNNVQQLKNGTA